MTGEEIYFQKGQTCGVPGTQNDSTASRGLGNFANHFTQLVDALSGGICAEVPPLKSVNRPQISSATMT